MVKIGLLWNKVIVLYNILYLKSKHVVFGRALRIRGVIRVVNEGQIQIGDSFVCSSGNMSNVIGRNIKSSLRTKKGAVMIIGNNVGCSSVALRCAKSLVIGNNVKIGALTIISDSDSHTLDPLLRQDPLTDSSNAKCAPINIADNVFIGMSCIICKGVSIGENSIVGAGSVVTKSIPANEIWAGNPARFIRTL